VLGNRNAAVEAAATKLLRQCNSWTQLDCEEAPRAVVKKLAEWAGKVLNVLKGAEIRAAPSEKARKQVRERWKRSTETEAISAAIERVEAEVQSLEMELFDYLEVKVDATLEGGFRKLKAALAGIEDRLRVMKVLPALLAGGGGEVKARIRTKPLRRLLR
jgi:translation initiation factor 2 alpha subunit (eIF-2alpha)